MITTVRKRKITDFAEKLKEAISKHGNNFKALSNPKKAADIIRIRCNKHGEFKLTFRSFASVNMPCIKCRAEARRGTTEDFVKRSKKKHKNKYDYTDTLYLDGQTKVKINCPRHGDFYILPHAHLRGPGGCLGCKTGKLSQIEFIKRSKKLFPRKYDYSLTIFENTGELVTIICKKAGHGPFTQLAGNHLTGREGCEKCARENLGRTPTKSLSKRSINRSSTLKAKRLTQDEFERRARDKHKNRYDLSKAVYETQYDTVTVICKDHGPFLIAPHNLWRGGNCPLCAKTDSGNSRRLNPKVFLQRAIKKHKKNYDLSEVNYTTAKVKITPICKDHGKFEVLPANFLKGTGCPHCSSEEHVELMKSASFRKDIVKSFVAIHGERYDYSKVDYQGLGKKVEIICKKHGSFYQLPSIHLENKGCQKCGAVDRADAQRLTQEEVLSRFKELHGDRFDYSQFRYIDNKTKSIIICREVGHGPFKMRASSHFEEQGCPKCADPKGERRIAKWLNDHKIEHIQQFSILPPNARNNSFRLRYDFLLPEINLLIEYDGEQHYRPVRFHGMSEAKSIEIFEITQKRDRAKNRWAKKNGYALLRISYTEDTIAILERKLLSVSTK